MTDKQIIIDGVDVSGCQHVCITKPLFSEEAYIQCSAFFLENEDSYCDCADNPNCNYKNWKRKEQEYEELKKSVLKQCPNCVEEYLNPKGAELYNENVQLKKALTEIKEIAEKHAPRCAVSCPNDEYKCEICMLDDLKQILQKCEVLDE